MKIKGIRRIDNQPVYNMNVEVHHNFSVNGGLIVHNCDALRGFAIMKTVTPVPQIERGLVYDFNRDIDKRKKGSRLYD